MKEADKKPPESCDVLKNERVYKKKDFNLKGMRHFINNIFGHDRI